MNGYVYWVEYNKYDGITYYVVIASNASRANKYFYDFVKKYLGSVYDACFKPCETLTLPFGDGFSEGEVWNLEALMRNYHYEC